MNAEIAAVLGRSGVWCGRPDHDYRPGLQGPGSNSCEHCRSHHEYVAAQVVAAIATLPESICEVCRVGLTAGQCRCDVHLTNPPEREASS